MKATIWAPTFVMPSALCVNCCRPASNTVALKSEGGLASSAGKSHGVHGLLVGAIAGLAADGTQWEVPYCPACLDGARKKPPEIALTAILFGVIWLVALLLLWNFQTHNLTFGILLFALLAILGLFGAWFRHQREPPVPPRTTRWRAFAILNAGKDLFRGNRPFVKIEYSNPRFLDEIRRANPGIDIS